MVTDAKALEDVAAQISEIEPEVVEGANAQLTFPYPERTRLSNFVRFYHPDGTWSEIAAPTFNPARPTPYRERFLMKYLKKRVGGQQWFFLTKQAEPPELPYRCFVKPGGRQCTKRLGSLPDLYMHIMGRHGEEAKLYGDFMKAIERKMQQDVAPEILTELGLGDVKPAPDVFYCRNEGCPRFFDSESGRNQHEYTCPHRKKED